MPLTTAIWGNPNTIKKGETHERTRSNHYHKKNTHQKNQQSKRRTEQSKRRRAHRRRENPQRSALGNPHPLQRNSENAEDARKQHQIRRHCEDNPIGNKIQRKQH